MNEVLIAELQKQNRRLKQLLVVGGLTASSVFLLAAKGTLSRQKFTEIDVERINVVMPDGKKEIVLSNRARIPAPVVDGVEGQRTGPARPGLIFYNSVGDESGGLIFDGKLDKDGKPAAGTHFSMDRFGGDQQLTIGHYESNGHMETGLKIFDQGVAKEIRPLRNAIDKAPEGPEKQSLQKRWEEAGGRPTQRLFIGRTLGKSPAVVLADAKGNPRIMMLVSSDGQPMLNFLDEQGKVIQSLPHAATTAAKP